MDKTDQSGSEQRLVRRFRAHVKGLNEVLKQMKKIHPAAELYLAGSLHIMRGPHHDDRTNSGRVAGEEARQDRIIASEYLKADGGDW